MHLGGRCHAQDLDPGRVGQAGGVAGNQRDLGTALSGYPGHRITLFSGTAVTDEPDRIQCLPCSAGGDDDLHPGQIKRQRIAAGQ